ncbi:MAG TPA: hypothetical protein VEX65_12020 [Flavisolibacter sp.]|nr:hypothetical protein [Flavisolibacter sp.]
MLFTIAFQHRRTTLVFRVREERDEIFIAIPATNVQRRDKIFLTRANSTWVGDCRDKRLVLKLGRGIDAALIHQSMPKHQAI